MTNTDALMSIVGSGITQQDAANLLTLQGIDPDATYSVANKCTIYGIGLSRRDKNFYKGVKSESENDYQVTYDTNSFAKSQAALASDSGCPDLMDKYPDPYATDDKIEDATCYW